MIEFTLWDIVRNLLLAARWTVVLSLIAFIGGATVGLVLTFMRLSSRRWLQHFTSLYVDLFQGTPLLMQLFLIFFGAAAMGHELFPNHAPCDSAAGAATLDSTHGGVFSTGDKRYGAGFHHWLRGAH
jgi:His/Glu/Gln/Arg/opine family amino acid ABC transporter permease subunit